MRKAKTVSRHWGRIDNVSVITALEDQQLNQTFWGFLTFALQETPGRQGICNMYTLTLFWQTVRGSRVFLQLASV
jgi:hypothetical protein